MQTSKALYKHNLTGEIYAIETAWDGTLIGSFGPVEELGNTNSYEINSDNNDWLQKNKQELILLAGNCVV